MREPGGDEHVVRFGARGKFEKLLLRDALYALEDPNVGRPDVSVWCAPAEAGESDEQTATRICDEITSHYNGKWFRQSIAAPLRRDGFHPRQDDPTAEPHPFHYNVDIGTVDEDTAARFFSSFGPESRNGSWTK